MALKATCRKSAVRRHAEDIWTVTCTVDYTDGSEATGVASLLAGQGKTAFEPAG